MIFFDGGMGTMLQRYGLSTGDCPDYYNITHPDIVQRIHKEYADAGSNYITTNTFGTSPIKLADYDLSDKVEAICEAAVRTTVWQKPLPMREQTRSSSRPSSTFRR